MLKNVGGKLSSRRDFTRTLQPPEGGVDVRRSYVAVGFSAAEETQDRIYDPTNHEHATGVTQVNVGCVAE